jgi:uncharacterized protein YutE (UPF0331/DUF86 family)
MTDEDIQTKVAILRDNIEKLERLAQDSYDEFIADFRNLDSALHRLQTSIQALIDIGSYTTAQLGLGAPSTSREVLERLEQAGQLPSGATERFGPIFGFRNRVVHLYDRIDPQIVFRILVDERADIEELLRLLLHALVPEGNP